MALSKRLRFEILRRDNHTCRYCGASAPDARLTVDHVLPEALGGTDIASNLVTACEPCNGGKSSIAPDAPLVEDVQNDAFRWARAIEIARATHRRNREAREAYVAYFFELWAAWKCGPSYRSQPVPLDDDWQSSIERFYEYDLDPDDLDYAVRTAMANNKIPPESTFRYFCGVCWNTIRHIQDVATEVVMVDVDDEIYGEH